MRLLVNVTSLYTPLTGIGHYTREMLDRLLSTDQVEDVMGSSPYGWQSRTALQDLVNRPPENDAPRAAPTPDRNRIKTGFVYLAKRSDLARRAARALRDYRARASEQRVAGYVYWEPNYMLLPINNRAVTTIHDLSHLIHPEHHPKTRLNEMARLLPDSVQRAARINTVSHYSKATIMEHLNVSSDRIDVVPPGVAECFRAQHSAAELEAVRSRLALPDRFLLYVGTLEPRKNLINLVRAHARLPQDLKTAFPLVLVGTRGWQNEELESLLTPAINRGEVIRLGYVPQTDLPKIYSLATALCYVSVFEGFGMPVAEAMASGTPVITSTTSSMPEVAQGSACLVDPYAVEEITDALISVITDEALQGRMRAQGLALSEKFTWEASSRLLLKSLSAAESC